MMGTPLADKLLRNEKLDRQAGTKRFWFRVGSVVAVCAVVVGAVGFITFLPILLFWGPVIFGSSQTHVEAVYKDLPEKAKQFATEVGTEFEYHNMCSGSKVAMKYSCTRQQFEDWAFAMEYELSQMQVGDTIKGPVFSGWSPYVDEIEVNQEGVLEACAQWRAGVVVYTFLPDRQEVLIWASGW